MIKPNLFIIGAPKAATSSLHSYLGQHPEICMSHNKEPGFFARGKSEWTTGRVITDMGEYLSLFAAKHCRYLGEATPSYLASPKTPQSIFEFNPSAKCVAVLRDPVERAYSNWLMDVREGFSKEAFVPAVLSDYQKGIGAEFERMFSYYRQSIYAEALQRYRHLFGDQVLVVLYEDLKESVDAVLLRITEFLELEKCAFDTGVRHNSASVPRNAVARTLFHNLQLRKVASRCLGHAFKTRLRSFLLKESDKPSLPQEDRQNLIRLFDDDIKRTAELIGRDLTAWSR